jgi:hypothetical protein
MKVIEAMKQIKTLQIKAADLAEKVAKHCADLEHENPVYGTVAQQTDTVRGWIQAHGDILKEILRLRIAIQRTNLMTPVEIDIGGKVVTKTVAEWIHRRRDLAQAQYQLWAKVGDRGLKETMIPSTNKDVPPQVSKIRRYYDPAERDAMINLYRSEPTTIDARLEVVNAVTDLAE